MALAVKENFKTSKHKQLIGWFNKEFVHSGKVDPKYSKIIMKSFEYRMQGDYADNVEINREIVDELFSEMEILKNIIVELLSK